MFFFMPALLLSILTPLFLASSSLSLSYFVLAVLLLERLGKRSHMSSTFPIDILKGTYCFPTAQLHVHKRRSRRDSLVAEDSVT